MRERLFVRVCLMLSVLILFSGCGHSSSPGNQFAAAIAEGRAAVKEAMEESKATAISVALISGDRVVWSEAFGTADREAALPATRATLYGACSISKMLATVAAMILVDQGRISLDEPVTTYIRNFSMPLDGRYRDMTVRMLLNHSSGLPGNNMRGAMTVSPFAGYAAQMMGDLKYQRLKHPPGAISAYNNDGFTMIENLVREVSGQEYPDFVRQNILAPLGMKSSRYQTEKLPDHSCARSYAGNSLLPLYSFNVYASGGLFSTPEELSRLAIMLVNKGIFASRRILSSKAVEAMEQDQRMGSFNPAPYEDNRFGLGWDTVAQPGLAAVGVKALQKTGDMSGYYGTNVVIAPHEKLGVVVFGASNGFDSSHAVKISERIMLRALVEMGRIEEMPKPLPAMPLPVKDVTSDEIMAYSGFYASGTTAYRLRYAEDKSLSVDEYQDDWTEKYSKLKLRGDGWYAADGDPFTAVRLLSRAGHRYFAVRLKRGLGHYTINVMFGQKLDDRPPVSTVWRERLAWNWLPVNADPCYFLMLEGDPGFRFRTINGLTGYLMGNKILRDMVPVSDLRLDGMFLMLPDGVRDLEDAGIEDWYGESWLRLGGYLYRPLAGIHPLAAGRTAVVIDADGFTQWRRLPSAGALSISGSTRWFLYDADFDKIASGAGNGAPVFSGAGPKYLALFGAGRSTINLELTVK